MRMWRETTLAKAKAYIHTCIHAYIHTHEQLDWTKQEDLDAVKKICPQGFDVIVGTDVVFTKTLVCVFVCLCV
jgi:hypothetical protein